MKLKVYIFLSIYLLSCIGITLNFHYCSGELESIALYHIDGDDCCGEEEEKSCNCCKDKFVMVDTDDTDNAKATLVADNNFVKILPHQDLPVAIICSYSNFTQQVIPINHAPPNISEEHIFLKNCTILI